MPALDDINKSVGVGQMSLPLEILKKVTGKQTATPLTPLQIMTKDKGQAYWAGGRNPQRDMQHAGGAFAAMGERLPDIALAGDIPKIDDGRQYMRPQVQEEVVAGKEGVKTPVAQIAPTALPEMKTQPFKAPQLEQIQMPDAPKYKRRTFEERLNAITGGKRIGNFGQAMAALMLDGKLQGEDANLENFEKGIYGKQIQALPQFASENRHRTYAPIDAERQQGALDVQRYNADINKAQLGIQQGEFDLKKKQAPLDLKIKENQAANLMTKEETMRQNKIMSLWKEATEADTPEAKKEITDLIYILQQGGDPEYGEITPAIPAQAPWFGRNTPEVPAVMGYRARAALPTR